MMSEATMVDIADKLRECVLARTLPTWGDLDDAQAEIERLRAALKNIIELGDCYPSPATAIARDALSNEQFRREEQ